VLFEGIAISHGIFFLISSQFWEIGISDKVLYFKGILFFEVKRFKPLDTKGRNIVARLDRK
jgi:hypothetical protein